MKEKFRASDAMEWNSHGNIGRGKVRKKLTGRTLLKGHAYAAEVGHDDGSGREVASAEPGETRQPEATASDRA